MKGWGLVGRTRDLLYVVQADKLRLHNGYAHVEQLAPRMEGELEEKEETVISLHPLCWRTGGTKTYLLTNVELESSPELLTRHPTGVWEDPTTGQVMCYLC